MIGSDAEAPQDAAPPHFDTGREHLEWLATEKGMMPSAVQFVVRGDIDPRFRRVEYHHGPRTTPLVRSELAWSVERNVLARGRR